MSDCGRTQGTAMTLPAAAAAPVPGRLLLTALALGLAFTPALPQEQAVPSYLHVCKGNDPQLGDCIKESMENLRPQLATGLPELNVPALEPLQLQQLVLSQGSNLHIVANDVRVYDTTTFQLREVTVDEGKTEFRLRLAFPRLHVKATYAVDGRLLTLPMSGTGPLQLNATDVEAEVALHTAAEERGGEVFLALRALEVQVQEVRHAAVRLDNLFGGDPMLGEVVNAAVNAHFPRVLQELRPSVQRALQIALQELVEKILSTYPLRLLFPED